MTTDNVQPFPLTVYRCDGFGALDSFLLAIGPTMCLPAPYTEADAVGFVAREMTQPGGANGRVIDGDSAAVNSELGPFLVVNCPIAIDGESIPVAVAIRGEAEMEAVAAGTFEMRGIRVLAADEWAAEVQHRLGIVH